MTKHLRFLIVLLMTLVWSAGWAAIGDTFKLVTDAKDLKDGDKIIIGSKASNVVLGAPSTEKSNKRAAVSATFSSDGVVAWKEGFDVITLESSASAWYLHSEAGYLYSELQNNKASTDLKNAADKSKAKVVLISISASGTAKISFKGVGTGRYIHYNNPVYGYYSQTTPSAQIYKLVNSGETKTPTKVSFGSNSGMTFTFTEGEYTDDTFTAPTATEKTGVAGTITYSSDNESAVKVNASTGELSFPGYGEATITATFTPNNTETYAVSTDSYKVKNEAKKSDNILTFSGELKSFDNVREYEKTLSEANVTLNGSDGKTYIFISNGGKNGSARFLLPTKTGKLQSPTFPSYINGYNVVITYGIGGTGYPSVTANGKKVTGTVKGDYNKGTGATLSLDVADGSAFTVTSGANALAISKIEITPNAVDETETITLNETATNNTIVAKTGVNVTLKRTMAKGVWNTICLPFGLTSEQITTVFGEGVKVAQLDEKSTGATLKFVDMTNTGIEASVPYLIKPVTDAPAEGYKFEGVEITEAAVKPTKVQTAGGLYFNGVYNMVDATKEVASDYNAAFLGKGNTIFGAQSNTKMKGFRAYFAIPTSVKASELRVVIDGTATSIKNIDSEVVESNAPVYNLQGQRVDGSNLTPGIYVKAGKKFVVK